MILSISFVYWRVVQNSGFCNFWPFTKLLEFWNYNSIINLMYEGKQYPFEVNNDGILVYKTEYRFVNPRLLKHDDINKEAYGVRKLRKH